MASVTDPSRTWGGSTLAERKTQRRAALLKAAADIIGEHGTTALTTKAVCERAGLIERYLYESFASRDGLLLATFDDALERASQAMITGFNQDPAAAADERLRSAFASAVDLAEAEPGAVRLLFIEASGDAVLRERAQSLQVTLEAVGAQFLTTLSPEPRTEAETALLAAGVVGAAINVFTGWTNGRLAADIPREIMIDVAVSVAQQIARTKTSLSPAEQVRTVVGGSARQDNRNAGIGSP
ncbi:TetR family transcriptional regulator [Mycobacteroides abscessus subsp. abscessus]|nr:TetR family transcriptional regulator [Mycobacteroides abscessus subsp. abscessus]